jgi:hypothetical protein
LGDASYDANPLHAVAQRKGATLLAPRRKAGRSISAGHKQTPGRLRSIELLESDESKRKQVARLRSSIERFFGWLTMRGGGQLPPWVRTLARVRRWMIVKLAIHEARRAA